LSRAINTVEVGLGERSYSIHIGPGALDLLMERLRENEKSCKIMVVTDERVYSLYSSTIEALANVPDNPTDVFVVPEGEGSKSFAHLEEMCRIMARRGLDRSSLVIAIGGGVVGDLAGLASSIFLRGIRVIQAPTTLLSMVDSSAGGKTGINIPEGKNLIGTFHQPEAVFADTKLLGTLEVRDWYSGMAEVVKIALTLDPELFGYLEGVEDLGPAGGLDTELIITSACRRKVEVVEADEREAGPRRVLNFGHTLAHALEAAMGYGEIRHGEAVQLGMKASLSFSREACGLPEDDYRKALRVINRIPVPAVNPGLDLESYLSRDKKSLDGRVQVVLLERIGQSRILSLDDPRKLVSALWSLQQAV
jgi:3-dehydroquinate synthase